MTHPHERILIQDIFTGTAFLIIGMLIISAFQLGGNVSPADECANTITSNLSPFQVHRLTGAEYPELPRDQLLSWCSINVIDWERDMEAARQLPEFPHHLDMLID